MIETSTMLRIALDVLILSFLIVFRKTIFRNPTAKKLHILKILIWISLFVFAIGLTAFFCISIPLNNEIGHVDLVYTLFSRIYLPIFTICIYYAYKNVLKHKTE